MEKNTKNKDKRTRVPPEGRTGGSGAGPEALDRLLILALFALAALFVLESDDCYFAYWRYDSLKDFLLTRPDTAHARIVGVPQNGRYLGNLLGVLLAKAFETPLFPLRAVFFAGGLLALAACVGRVFGQDACRRREYAVLTLSLLLLAPRGIWQEVYSWGAAYANYVTPMAGLALLYLWTSRALNAPSAARLPGCGALSFLCCLFMEPVTVFLVLASSLALLYPSRSGRRPAPACAAVWAGSLLGAAVMFSAPGYGAVGSDGLREMGLGLALDNFSAILVGTLFRPAAAALTVTGLLLWHLRRQGGREWKLCALAAAPAHLICLWGCAADLADPGNYVQIPAPTPLQTGTALYLAGLWLVMLALWKGGEARLRVVGLAAALCLFSGPLLVVSLYGNRNFFSGYTVLTVTALALYDAARRAGMRRLSWPRTAALLTALALVFLYGCNCVVFHQRLALGREAAAQGQQTVTLPLLPFAGFARNEQIWKGDVSYLIYRESPWDVSFTFVPYRQWAGPGNEEIPRLA